MGAQGALGTDKKYKISIEKRGSTSWTIPVSDFKGYASLF
jgi:hypothetical protein